MINEKQVKELANTMKFALTEEEIKTYSQRLSNIANYLELIQEVDTTDVSPTYHGTLGKVSLLRKDEAVESDQVEGLLKNARDTKDTFIRVPAILDDGQGGA